MRWTTRHRQDRNRDRDSRGQAMVEFALIAPFLFVLILGIIEAGRFLFFYEVLNNAAREGARYAIVHGADAVCPSGPPPPGQANLCDPSGTNVIDATSNAAFSLVGLGSMVLYDPVWTSRSAGANPAPGDSSTGHNGRGEYVTVFVDFIYQPLVKTVVGIDFLPDVTIRGESTLVVNY